MARPPRRRRFPRLDSAIIGDDEALGATVGAVLRRDPGLRKRQRQIIRRQVMLQRIVSGRAWKAYLDLEQISVARFSDALDLVARWAFGAGCRFERRRTR